MNLHAILIPLQNVALWLTVVGRNGRSIGDHLWPVDEGTPPAFDTANHTSWNRNYWTPARFTWRAFSFQNIMRSGYVPPLCGRRSQSTRPRVNAGWGTERCERCLAVATQRGIIPLTYNEAINQSAVNQAVIAEGAAWTAAGRPTEWPSPT